MKTTLTIVFLLIAGNTLAQTLIGGPCEGCEAVFEYGTERLTPVDTLPDFKNDGPKLELTGTVYKNDGETPVANVILYIYHTNQKGIYEKLGNETGWGRRHGYLRGWIKTNSQGEYIFYTLRPASYPNSKIPAHIHGTILEPDGKYYYIDEWHFKDDSFLKGNELNSENARGGSGVVELKKEGNILTARRDIILGKNVPGYK